jgi:SAM-dependent methyltransferase
MSRVRSYYDSNTWKFLITGSQGAIHRELWAPGIVRKRDAMHHAHALVVDEVKALGSGGQARVLDLGCGVGAATQYVAERLPVEILGVSISPVQIRTARRWLRLRRKALLGTCVFREADFCALPADLTGIDLAFAIEAFVHAPDSAAFFREVSRALRPGGRLVIIDDFLSESPSRSSREAALLEDVRSGWHMGSLLTVERAAELAGTHGLRLQRADDLSPWQRLGRPRDRMIHAALPLLRIGARYSHWCESLVGGDALQSAHRAGLIQYRQVVFERQLNG